MLEIQNQWWLPIYKMRKEMGTTDQKLSKKNKEKCPFHMESRKLNCQFLQGKVLV
jgi:hypothetical protein